MTQTQGPTFSPERREQLSETPDGRLLLQLIDHNYRAIPERSNVLLELPRGRGFRYAFFPQDIADAACGFDWAGQWRSLVTYLGVFSSERKKIAVSVEGGPALELAMMHPESPETSPASKPLFELHSEKPNQAVSLSRPQGALQCLTLGNYVLTIDGFEFVSAEEADRLVERVADSLTLQTAERYRFAINPQVYRDPNERIRQLERVRAPLHFPDARYPRGAAALYRASLDGNLSPGLRFLVLYQVLESFFAKYADREALGRIERICRRESFERLNPDAWAELLSAAGNSASGKGEEEQLKMCITGITEIDDLRAFLEVQELSDYLKEATVLGVDPIDTSRGIDLIARISSRIYSLRCRLVHSKVDHSKGSAIIPGSNEDRLMTNELPLMDYLARSALLQAGMPL